MSLVLAAPADALDWLRQRLVLPGARLRTDSRQVRPGDAFIAWPGQATDGRQHVAAALQAGAAACLVEAEGADRFQFDPAEARIAVLGQLKAALGPIAAGWYGQPASGLTLVAVTATNGKSSTAWWTAQALTALGRRCGVVGTLGIGEPPLAGRAASVAATGLTTPDPVTLQAALRRMADQGFAACAIEASSIGLAEHRLAGTPIAVAQFINFTRDHLDYHRDMAAYWAAKRQLFQWPGLRAATVDLDDPQGPALAAELAQAPMALWTCAVHNSAARLRAEGLHHSALGLSFTLAEHLADGVVQRVQVRSSLIGDYNAHNLLAVIGALRALGVPLQQVADVLPQLTPVPGRMQRVRLPAAAAPAGQGEGEARARPLPELVVDYAHTPDALDKALAALQPMTIARGGRLWCVFGCGGNRDASKRPLMGAVAQRMADRVVLTSDNPRGEPPEAILQQILAGIDGSASVDLIEDRAAAIAHAVARAEPQDVVLLAGKGHEDYQEVAGQRRPFSDAVQAEAALALRAEAQMQAQALAQAQTQPAAATAPAVVMMTLAEAAALLPGAQALGLATPAALAPIRRVHTDSRSLQPGDLFVALRGERFDAHDFLPQARADGAVAALAEHGLAEAGLPGLQVPDALLGLQQLATAWRRRFELPLIAVTGSNGKTTVTQMLAAVLRAWQGDAALATAGNFNNHIGLPLTVLRLRPQHRAAVLELGMNHAGEIALLAAVARPTVALVNNAQREHQEFMASVEAVACENGSAITALGHAGVAVFPADDPHAPVWQALAGSRRQLRFALDGALQYGQTPAEVTARGVWQPALPGDAAHAARPAHWAMVLSTPEGPAELALHAPGQHNLRNALAAAASALAAGVPLAAVVQGLQDFRPVAGRSQLATLQRQGQVVTLVNDSYNANPDSVRAAIDLLVSLPGPHWLVLGDMGEVGDQGPAFHTEVGGYARSVGIAHLWTAGSQSAGSAAAFGAAARHFNSTGALVEALAQAPACAAVLVKGSRFMRMEAVVQALQAQDRAQDQAQDQAEAQPQPAGHSDNSMSALSNTGHRTAATSPAVPASTLHRGGQPDAA